MSSADYEERGGTAALRATSAVHSPADLSHFPITQPSSSLDETDSSTWSSLAGPLTANTSSTNLSPAHFSSTLTFHPTSSRLTKPTSPNLDFPTDTIARNESLLRDTVFPDWKDDTRSSDAESPEELQKKDPLGTQIWKLYSRTKSRLPNQERMENLTWRMMAMNLRRREQQQAAYAKASHSASDTRSAAADHLFSGARKATPVHSMPISNAPSGIAQQLRRSVDISAEPDNALDPMNLDDYIIPSSVASPSGITSPALSESLGQAMSMYGTGFAATALSKAQVHIPQNLPPSSLPQSSVALHRISEFDYVQKRVRKTSIDERRGVSLCNMIHAE